MLQFRNAVMPCVLLKEVSWCCSSDVFCVTAALPLEQNFSMYGLQVCFQNLYQSFSSYLQGKRWGWLQQNLLGILGSNLEE